MAYTTLNIQIFTAAYCGALAGMGLSDRQITDQSAASYAGLASVAGAYAQAVDTAWGAARSATLLDTEAIQSASQAFWQDRSPIPDSTNTLPATHASAALAMIATITAAESYYAAQGLTPPAIPGGSGGGGFPNVANLTALGAIDWSTSGLANGFQYYVHTQRSFWILSQTGTETVDGVTVIAAMGGGRWIRDLSFSHPSWTYAGSYYIDATNGNDEYTGQAQTAGANNAGPLKTHAELARRLGSNPLKPPISPTVASWNEMQINVLTDLPNTDPINCDFVIPRATFVRYTGNLGKSTVYTGSVTAFSALSVAGNTPYQVTDSAIGSWTTYLGKRVRITNAGTNQNACFWVGKDLGAQQARISTPGTMGWLSGTSSPRAANFTVKNAITVGDTFVIENFPTVTFGLLNPKCIQDSSGLSGTVLIGELIGRTGNTYAGQTPASGRSLNFYSCILNIATADSSCAFVNCYGINGLGINLSSTLSGAIWIAGMFTGAGPISMTLQGINLAEMTLCQGVPVTGAGITITSVAIFDCTVGFGNPGGNGINVGSYANTYQTIGGIGIVTTSRASDIANMCIIGSGNAGVGIFVKGGCNFYYPTGSTIKVTGTGGDFKLDNGTTSNVWDQTASAGAGAWLAPRNNTWANLAAAVGAAGFGGSAHNVQANAHILQAATG